MPPPAKKVAGQIEKILSATISQFIIRYFLFDTYSPPLEDSAVRFFKVSFF